MVRSGKVVPMVLALTPKEIIMATVNEKAMGVSGKRKKMEKRNGQSDAVNALFSSSMNCRTMTLRE